MGQVSQDKQLETNVSLYVSAAVGIAFASLALVFAAQPVPFGELLTWVAKSPEEDHFVTLGQQSLWNVVGRVAPIYIQLKCERGTAAHVRLLQSGKNVTDAMDKSNDAPDALLGAEDEVLSCSSQSKSLSLSDYKGHISCERIVSPNLLSPLLNRGPLMTRVEGFAAKNKCSLSLHLSWGHLSMTASGIAFACLADAFVHFTLLRVLLGTIVTLAMLIVAMVLILTSLIPKTRVFSIFGFMPSLLPLQAFLGTSIALVVMRSLGRIIELDYCTRVLPHFLASVCDVTLFQVFLYMSVALVCVTSLSVYLIDPGPTSELPFARKINLLIPVVSKALGVVLLQVGLDSSALAHLGCALIFLGHFPAVTQMIWSLFKGGAHLLSWCAWPNYYRQSLETGYFPDTRKDKPEFLPFETTTESRTWRMPAGCEHKVFAKLEDEEMEDDVSTDNKVFPDSSNDSLEEKTTPPQSPLVSSQGSPTTPQRGFLTPLINPETGRIIIKDKGVFRSLLKKGYRYDEGLNALIKDTEPVKPIILFRNF